MDKAAFSSQWAIGGERGRDALSPQGSYVGGKMQFDFANPKGGWEEIRTFSWDIYIYIYIKNAILWLEFFLLSIMSPTGVHCLASELLFKTWSLHYPHDNFSTEWHRWRWFIRCSFLWSHKRLYTIFFTYSVLLPKTCKHSLIMMSSGEKNENFITNVH